MNPFGDDDYAKGPALRAELDQLTVQHRVLRLDRDGLYKRFVKLEEEVGQLRKAEKAADAEIKRLRAENLLLAMANTDREQLKAENAELRKQAWRDQPLVDWYERREKYVEELRRRVGREVPDDHFLHVLSGWEAGNPKPGAGT